MAASPTQRSFTTTLSQTNTEGFSSTHQALSSSISSLASSVSARTSGSTVSKTYRQSSTLFLTRRLPEALTTILPLLAPPSAPSEGVNGTIEPAPVAKASRNTRIKVWTLYIAILNAIVALEPEEGKEAFGSQEWRSICTKVRDGDIWEEVVTNGYHGTEGDVDPDVVINLATLLLTHARTQTLNQKRLENFLAASSSPNLDITNHFKSPTSPRPSPRRRSSSKGRSGADTPRDLNARVKILELYTLHVLIRNNEWDYAREFISVSSVLDDERREAFLQALQSLQEDQQESEKKEREEQERQDEKLRRDLEEARRLRAENEEREKRQVEQERARREGSEVDYGIDTRSTGESSNGRPRRSRLQQGAAAKKARSLKAGKAAAGDGSTSSNKNKAVAPASFGAGAAVMFTNVRAMVERMSATLQTNPMLLMRFLAFIVTLVLMFGKKNMRERIKRLVATSWTKVGATAGMGVKVSYI
ncbi:unnamed protein product [Discula destructiva]